VYNYSVTAFDADDKQVGSSVAASSVRLTAQSQVGKIQLDWSAFVPWSNQIQTLPNKHEVYRGPEGATTKEELVLIDEIDVGTDGFRFIDEGQHGALDEAKTYCYLVMTRGGYGNPDIPQPLENYSQIICAQLGDSIPPCKPVLMVNLLNCEQYIEDIGSCGENLFKNTLYWKRYEDGECDTNILGYKIYRSSRIDGDYLPVLGGAIQTDTFFIDDGINSYAYCYKISAVDRSLNESELSDPVCNDNCPYYELPNVFSPNDDRCNDLFSAYSDRPVEMGEEIKCELTPDARSKCARFVEAVKFKVYNRWGQEVYDYEGSLADEGKSIYIDWDGKDNNGGQLPSAVYYYVAEVTYDIVSADKIKIVKGWVHLVR
jgi:hypothetical protein